MMRYHPLTIGFRIFQLVKNSLLIAIILFVMRKDSDFWLIEYGRYAFVLFFIWRLFYIIIAWFFERYEWKDRTFHIHKGIFIKQTSAIPFSKIQNVTRKTSFFHKMAGLTSLTFETAMDGKDDAIHFEILSKQHAGYLIELVQLKEKGFQESEADSTDEEVVDCPENDVKQEDVHVPTRTVHFTPQRKDLWKASFTSLSFLAIIPVIAGVMDYLEPFLPDANQAEGLFRGLIKSGWLLFIIIVIAIIVAVIFGVARTFIHYGKYEISSDASHIYIDRGILDESYFAIEKRKVQGLEMQQTWLKRIFGLAEVKLISSSNPGSGDGTVNVNSLYPFLPMKQAYQLIEDLLPIYRLNGKLEKLPRKSLYIKLLKPSWVWMVATIGLAFFRPRFFQMDQAWWIVSLTLLCFILLHRILDYIHTRYAVTSDQVQWWNGGLTNRMFITKRKNIIEIAHSQTMLQKYFHVASIKTMNRSIPAHIETIDDIPLAYALAIENWYLNRQEDVELKIID
ncbi:PH domain-containing protein [Sediminibacillus massiliensis]|uniref:PH domain-containing protein n=1 Tax=Sediminibacillus massiliensis TaxID=1926277 RepID=UPI001FEB6864|nr:PH domain-containing protein [Sediminibacillus massiliensis]